MSFSPIIRVRKLLNKMKQERESPRMKRVISRTTSEDLAEKPRIYTKESEYDLSVKEFARPNKYAMYSSSKPIITDGIDHFKELPIEAVFLILSVLDSDDLSNLRLVNKEWRQLSDDDLIWKHLCFYDWNIKDMIASTWKETYIRLEELFSEGVWEGMSKWIEPPHYDNEQKTTAKLQFHKRRHSESDDIICKSSPSTLKRADALQDSSMESYVSPVTSASSKEEQESQGEKNKESNLYRISGGGITINCTAPSPFKIEGARLSSDETGSSFSWKKQFEKHTSVYEGKVDVSDGTVSGSISYHDGTTHWKGVFFYAKANRSLSRVRSNQAIA